MLKSPFGRSSGFIAATALACDVELFTLNKKDFRFIEGLKLYVY